ncbi:unnamed protein product [Camellia sinensis]
MSSCCDESGEVCQIPATTTQVGSPSCGGGGDLRSVDSGESSKLPAVKDRRGCYKRKKSTSESWITGSPTMEDSYAWRKYGQKQILKLKTVGAPVQGIRTWSGFGVGGTDQCWWNDTLKTPFSFAFLREISESLRCSTSSESV